MRPHLGMNSHEYRAFLAAAFDGPIPQDAIETLAEMERSEAEAARRKAAERGDNDQ